VSLALLGIDAIATELENPFGDDANDLDILGMIAELESEAMEMLRLSGDEASIGRFCLRTMPALIRKSSCRRLRKQLACKDYAADDVIKLEAEEEGDFVKQFR